jgi:hypothetical protein
MGSVYTLTTIDLQRTSATVMEIAAMQFLLLVTWFTPGQPTSSYQVTFTSEEACQAARASVMGDAERLRQETAEQGRKAGLPPQMAGMAAPSVSAVCVAQ